MMFSNHNPRIKKKIQKIESVINLDIFEERSYTNYLVENKLSLAKSVKTAFAKTKYKYKYDYHECHLLYVDENNFRYHYRVNMNRGKNGLSSLIQIYGENFCCYIGTGKIHTDDHELLQCAIDDFVNKIMWKLEYIEDSFKHVLVDAFGKTNDDWVSEDDYLL